MQGALWPDPVLASLNDHSASLGFSGSSTGRGFFLFEFKVFSGGSVCLTKGRPGSAKPGTLYSPDLLNLVFFFNSLFFFCSK